MTDSILSVGIDIGTSTTQLIFSRLHLENQAAAFTVPRFAITEKEILYRSQIHFTPLLSDTVIDTEGVRAIVDEEYCAAGIDRSRIDTGAVIITGETARKDNAREVLQALSGYAGEFVVATAGPDLESVLAARGASIDRYSDSHACCVLNFDIGGGTSNLALFCRGELSGAGCVNVGGRLIKLDPAGRITYLSPVLAGRFPLQVGQVVTPADLSDVIAELVQALEEAGGLRPHSAVLEHYLTTGAIDLPAQPIFSFSGGVADLIYDDSTTDWLAYGDIGVLLGRAIRASRLFAATHIRGSETIRATVVGAGAHTTDVSGSTIRYKGAALPVKNLPVVSVTDAEDSPELLPVRIHERLAWHCEDGIYSPAVLALSGRSFQRFAQVLSLAEAIVEGARDYLQAGLTLYVCVEQDMAKALGQSLLALLPEPKRLVCIDSLQLQTGQYLDIGTPVADGSVLPVVIKTLIFES